MPHMFWRVPYGTDRIRSSAIHGVPLFLHGLSVLPRVWTVTFDLNPSFFTCNLNMGLSASKDFGNCHSLAPPRKSLVKGERFVRHDGTSDLRYSRFIFLAYQKTYEQKLWMWVEMVLKQGKKYI